MNWLRRLFRIPEMYTPVALEDIPQDLSATLSEEGWEPIKQPRHPTHDLFIAQERSRILDLQIIRATLIEANIDTESLGEYIQKLEVWLEGYRDGLES